MILADGFQFHPGSLPWLHLSWLITALLLLFIHSFYRKRLALGVFAGQEVLRHLIPSVSWGRQYARCAIVLAGILALILGIARPQWGSDVEEIRRKGIDLVVLLDLSRSMLAEDMPPSRLDWAKADLGELLGAMTGDRIALVAFAGRSDVRCPLTFDYGFFRRILTELKVGSVSLGGTAIGKAIKQGLKCFQDTVKNHKAILLITDGEDHEAFVKEAAEEARERGVRIFSIGVGDTGEGKRIPITDEKGNKVFVKDKEGKEVWTKMDPRVLLEAAQTTDGGYAPAYLRKEGDTQGEVTTVRDIYTKIVEKVRKKDLEAAKEERYKDRFQWFLLLGWMLLALEPLVRTRRKNPETGAAGIPGGPGLGLGTGSGSRTVAGKAAALWLAGITIFAVCSAPAQVRADEFRSFLREGNRLFAEGKFAEAEEKYIQAKTSRQEAAEIPYNIGNTWFQREDFPKAIDSYQEALKEVRERDLEEWVRYNLACARLRESEKHVGDLTSQESLQKGLDFLRDAIGGFRDVLEIDSAHEGSRKNLAIAQLRVKSLLDALKRLQEEAEKKAKEEDKDKKDPVELLKELIAEEKAAIALAEEALKSDEEIGKAKAARDRLADIEDGLKKALPPQAKDGAGTQGQDSPAAKAMADLEGLLKDPGFTIGGSEASEALKAAQAGDLAGAAAKAGAAGERVLKEIVAKREALAKTVAKIQADQGATLGKASGLIQGLRNLAEGTEGGPGGIQQAGSAIFPTGPAPGDPQDPQPAENSKEAPQRGDGAQEPKGPQGPQGPPALQAGPSAQGSPPPGGAPGGAAAAQPQEPLPPEVKERLLEVARQTQEATVKMTEALGHLGALAEALGKGAASPTGPTASQALGKVGDAQRSALALLEKALEEAEKLPKKEPPPQKPQDQKDNEKKDEKKKDEKKQDGKKEGGKDEKKDGEKKDSGKKEQDKDGKKDEKKMSKDEAEQALRKFLEKDENRRKDKERRSFGRVPGRGSLDKDW